MTPYFESSYARIDWDEAIQCAILTWKTYADGENFRGSIDKTLELVEQKKAKLYIADLRGMKVLRLEDQDWLTANWVGIITGLGVRRSAIILPRDILAQMTFQRVSNNMHHKPDLPTTLEERVFDNIEEAKAWLVS